jgi:hypothetical protein
MLVSMFMESYGNSKLQMPILLVFELACSIHYAAFKTNSGSFCRINNSLYRFVSSLQLVLNVLSRFRH